MVTVPAGALRRARMPFGMRRPIERGQSGLVFIESAEPLYLSVLAAFADAKQLHTFAGNALEQRAFRRTHSRCFGSVSLAAFMRRQPIPSGCKMLVL
jgi:hypothetical protein